MCHKEWKMGTMVERIQPVSQSNLLNNMVQVFANTGNTLPPSNLQGRMFARRAPSPLLFYQLSRLQPQIYALMEKPPK